MDNTLVIMVQVVIHIHNDCAHVSLAVEVKIPPEKVKEEFEKLEVEFRILFNSAFEDLKKNSSLESLKEFSSLQILLILRWKSML